MGLPSWIEVTDTPTVDVGSTPTQFFLMTMPSLNNRIKPILSEVNILKEVKKDINIENTISLQPQLYEIGIPTMFSRKKVQI